MRTLNNLLQTWRQQRQTQGNSLTDDQVAIVQEFIAHAGNSGEISFAATTPIDEFGCCGGNVECQEEAGETLGVNVAEEVAPLEVNVSEKIATDEKVG